MQLCKDITVPVEDSIKVHLIFYFEDLKSLCLLIYSESLRKYIICWYRRHVPTIVVIKDVLSA